MVLHQLMLAFLLLGAQEEVPPPSYAVTIPPIAMIVEELVQGRATVQTLIGPGASPHTYEPKPSDVKAVGQALALFYVADQLDGWVAKLPGATTVALLPMIPPERLRKLGAEEHDDHGHHYDSAPGEKENDAYHGVDAHIWLDPILVAQLVGPLQKKLCELDPDGCAIYQKNADKLKASLYELDRSLQDMLKPVKGKTVLITHSFLTYFLDRYGFGKPMLVAVSAGKEATPKHIAKMIKKIKTLKIRSIFTEVQLSSRPAEILAESSGLRVFILDPLGGLKGRNTYRDLLLYNARTLLEGLSE
jgi:ABC-type Zn uptake system ZnuABC Zn-binding protein ZnuA